MGPARAAFQGRKKPESSYSLEKFKLYETRARYYLIGWSKDRQHWRILKIDRSEPDELSLSEDPVVYTQTECNSVLQTVADGNMSTGGLQLVTKAHGVVGFIKFLECYYIILVTKRRQVGTICGHAVYSIEETALITVPHASVQREAAHSKLELRYKKLLSGVDLTKDFFFSYTYPLMQTFQRNALYPDEGRGSVDTMFVWNAFLTRGIRERVGNNRWTVPLIHGYFSQARLSLFGRIFTVTLIARRSRHFAGTRYLKRGVNDKGRVANDVETEQLVAEESVGKGHWPITSVVQNRGSIPLFWSQETSKLSPKPDIVLQRYDPVYQATHLHFEDLARRYGNPIIILNLIKTVEKRPREMILRREFANAVGYLNQALADEAKLKFIHWDFHKYAKSKGANVLTVLGSIAEEALGMTGFFFSGRESVATQRANRRAARVAPAGQDDVMQSTNCDVASRRAARGQWLGESTGSGLDADRSGPSESVQFSRDERVLGSGWGSASQLSVSSTSLEEEERGSWAEGMRSSCESEKSAGSVKSAEAGSSSAGEGNGMLFIVDSTGKHTTSPEDIVRSGSVFELGQGTETDGRDAGASTATPESSAKVGGLSCGYGRPDTNSTFAEAATRTEGASSRADPGREPHLDGRSRDSDMSGKEVDVTRDRDGERSGLARFQSGVLRTNCIDCLDRTNVAQYAYGLAALARQLHALGFISQPKLDPESGVAGTLMDMYQEMGDVLALQYGGSAAHNMVFPDRQGLWKATTHSRELLKTIRRYYSNAYTDSEKQDAINLFLGHFIPEENKPALWDLDNDYYLHMGQSAESPQEAPRTPVGDKSPPSLCLPPQVSKLDDPPRLKLTSFDKLAATQAAVKQVRLFREDMEAADKPKGETEAEDAHVLLSGPNWLFGAAPDHHSKTYLVSPRKEVAETRTRVLDEEVNGPDVTKHCSTANQPLPHSSEDMLDPGYTSADEDEWYGSTLLAGTIKTSPAYEHYLRLCQMTDQGALLSQSSSQTDLYRAYDNLAPTIGGLVSSDKELEARLAQQFEMLSSFDSFMREGQDGLVCV